MSLQAAYIASIIVRVALRRVTQEIPTSVSTYTSVAILKISRRTLRRRKGSKLLTAKKNGPTKPTAEFADGYRAGWAAALAALKDEAQYKGWLDRLKGSQWIDLTEGVPYVSVVVAGAYLRSLDVTPTSP